MNAQLPNPNPAPHNLSSALLRQTRERMFTGMPVRNGADRKLSGASRRNFLKGVLLGAAGLSLPWTSRGAGASAVFMSDLQASAIFHSVDPTGCIYTDAVINGSLKGIRENGSLNENTLIEVTLSIADVCSA